MKTGESCRGTAGQRQAQMSGIEWGVRRMVSSICLIGFLLVLLGLWLDFSRCEKDLSGLRIYEIYREQVSHPLSGGRDSRWWELRMTRFCVRGIVCPQLTRGLLCSNSALPSDVNRDMYWCGWRGLTRNSLREEALLVSGEVAATCKRQGTCAVL